MACKYGVGEHIHAVSFDQLWIALKFSWIGIYTGLMGTLVGKSAIGAMLYQVATPQQWKRKAFLFTACAFNFATGCTQLVLSIVQCTPHEKLWYQLTPGKCDREDIAFKFGYLQGLWNLQASMRTKVGFCVLMAGGMM
ncbi:hypothetical protein ANO11243_092940 [Dothideomycetidae sp. 11243]|nr:hypothetical protein ANO11243_092940 [fungal sp. No.11243]